MNQFIRHIRFCIASIKRNFSLTVINIVGLSIGVAVFLLINSYVFHELNVDQFHKNKDSVVRLGTKFYKGDQLDFNGSSTYPGVGPDLVEEFPEVINQCRLFKKYQTSTVEIENQRFREEMIFYADSSFFEVFSYPLISGDPRYVLREPHTAIIDELTARKYFGDIDPIGKRITIGSYDGEEHFVIDGVFKSAHNSHLRMAIIGSYSSYVSLHGQIVDRAWSWYDFYSYVQLSENADLQEFKSKLPAFIDKHIGDRLGNARMELEVTKLSDIYLQSENLNEAGPSGDGDLINLLIGVSFMILLIAWINYMNLYTAHSINRAKEVGLRKVLGSTKMDLWQQFMVESLFINGIAILFGLILFTSAIPWFNSISNLVITIDMIQGPKMVLIIFAIWVIGSCFTGIYPSMVLSSFRPVAAIKGLIKVTNSGSLFRKGLIVFQFLMGIVFIGSTLIVREQIDYLTNGGIGIDTEGLLAIQSPDLVTDPSAHERKMINFRDALISEPEINIASITSEMPGEQIGWWGGMRRIESPKDVRVTLYRMTIDEFYLPMYKTEFVGGLNFNSNSSQSDVIINQTAANALGFESIDHAVGGIIIRSSDTLNVRGVVKDFHQESIQKETLPTIFHFNINSEMNSIVIDAENLLPSTIEKIEQHFSAIFPETIFTSFRIKDYLDEQNGTYLNLLHVFTFFSVLAVLIALLGLLGLSSYYVKLKSKEVSIRKLHGASIMNLFIGLSRGILKHVLLANLIAIPFIMLFSSVWLDQFANRVSFNWFIPFITLSFTLLLSLMTIANQIIKISLQNPLDLLRYE